MTNFLNTSHFIKTTCLAVVLIISSISSASHAQSLLATVSTGGLEGQLILDANPQTIENMEMLNQINKGICSNDIEKLEKFLREIGKQRAEIEDQIRKETAAKAAEIKRLEEEIDRLRERIADAKRIIERHGGNPDTAPGVIELRAKLTQARLDLEKAKAPLKILEDQLSKIKVQYDFVEMCIRDAKITERNKR